MFSFHKPKVYRSSQGCCICKAKSSSSRFTDSKKYEIDFIECFQLTTPRKGEICNACVLLVKRFKRLPPGSDRHWGHVVDARVGPGLKSMTKFKKRKEEQLLQQQNGAKIINGQTAVLTNKVVSAVSERFGKIFKKTKMKKKLLESVKREGSPGSSDENSSPSSPISNHSDSEDIKLHGNSFGLYENHQYSRINTNEKNYKKYQRKGYRPFKNRSLIEASIIDNDFWIPVKTCCGYVYENKLIGAVLFDSSTAGVCAYHNLITNANSTVKSEIVPSFNKPTSTNSDGLIRHINISTNFILNTQSNDHLHEYTKNKGSNIVIPSLSAVKKHHLFYKRQNNDNLTNSEIFTSTPSDSTLNYNKYTKIEQCNNSTIENNHMIDVKQTLSIKNNYKISKLSSHSDSSSKAYSYLHKIKSDSSKIVKHSLNKLTPSKIKATDLNIVKNLVKICAEKSAKVNPLIEKKFIGNDKLMEALGHKFNDNSSDSGYEEILQEPNQKGRLATVRPVILTNGIKLHVQPENLVLAANLAGVSQIHQQSSFKGPVQNHVISVPQDVIQNGVISSTTNNSVDTLPIVSSSSQQISSTNQSNDSNLSQNMVSIKPNYFHLATN